MKKILFSAMILGLSLSVHAQDAADKKVQAGLVLGAGMNFQKMGTKNFQSNGVGGDFTIGATVNFTLRENIGFTTGVEFDFSSMKYKSSSIDGNIYYQYNDSEILRKKDATADNPVFLLSERRQNVTYLSIPTMMLFRTNYIGYFRYFGKFGLRNSFVLQSKTADKGVDFSSGLPVEASNNNMKRKSEMLFYKGAVGLVGGAEWNFTGSTCLVAEIGYYYGFTPLFYSTKDDRSHLYIIENSTSTVKYISNAATQSQLMLKISVLF